MSRSGISNALGIGLLVAGVLIGITGYYVATTYQTRTVTVTQTLTQSTTSTSTQILPVTTTQSATTTSTQVLPVTTTQVVLSTTTTSTQIPPVTTTQTVFSTATQTSFIVTTSTTSVYPLPTNVTLVFIAPSSTQYDYNIQAGSSSTSGAFGGNYTFPITGLFQGQTISVSAVTTSVSGCRSGEYFTMQLFLNGQMVEESNSFCGGNAASITYTV